VLSAPEEHKVITEEFTEVLQDAEVTFTAIVREEQRERERNKEALEEVQNTPIENSNDPIENAIEETPEITSAETEQIIEEDIEESTATLAVLDELLTTTQNAQQAVEDEQEVAIALQEENDIIILESDETIEAILDEASNESNGEVDSEMIDTNTLNTTLASNDDYVMYINAVTLYGEKMEQLFTNLDPFISPILDTDEEVNETTLSEDEIAEIMAMEYLSEEAKREFIASDANPEIIAKLSSLSNATPEDLALEMDEQLIEIMELPQATELSNLSPSLSTDFTIPELPEKSILNKEQLPSFLNLRQDLQGINENIITAIQLLDESSEIPHKELQDFMDNVTTFDTQVHEFIASIEAITPELYPIPELPVLQKSSPSLDSTPDEHELEEVTDESESGDLGDQTLLDSESLDIQEHETLPEEVPSKSAINITDEAHNNSPTQP